MTYGQDSYQTGLIDGRSSASSFLPDCKRLLTEVIEANNNYLETGRDYWRGYRDGLESVYDAQCMGGKGA